MGNSLPEDTRSEPFRMYLTAFYFCSYTMTSVGYGDIFPRNIIERVVCHGMGQGMIFTMIGPWEKIFGGSLNGG